MTKILHADLNDLLSARLSETLLGQIANHRYLLVPTLDVAWHNLDLL